MRVALGFLIPSVLGLGIIIGIGLALHRSPSYSGPPVAGFTTGGQSCSPICGHRNVP